MRRITEKDLQSLVDSINIITKSPMNTYVRIDGKTIACVGNFHLNSAYGGHCLVRINNESGGTINITSGFVTKRELYEQLQAFRAGIRAGKECK